MFRTGAQMLLLVLLVGLVLFREAAQWPAEAVDQRWTDWLSLNCGRRNTTDLPPVALIAIDDASLNSHPWPWTPLDFSLFFQAALPFQPDVLAVEEVLEWDRAAIPPSDRTKLPQYEQILRDVLLRCPKPLLGARLGGLEDPQVIPPLQEVPLLRKVRGDIREIPEYPTIERQPKEEYRLSATLGFTNLPARDHPSGFVPLVLRYRGQVVPSFVLQAAMLWHKVSPDEIEVEMGSHIALSNKARIPINHRGEMRVNWAVPRTVFSFDDLLLSAEQAAAKTKTTIPAERLAHSVTILARTDQAVRTVPIPLQPKVASGELFTSALGTIQMQWFIQRAPNWFDWSLIAAAALLSFLAPRARKGRVVIATIILLALYTGAAVLVFQRTLVWLPALLPVGLALFVIIFRLLTPDWVAKPKRPVIM
ncbi:CHASE2 domain-containing protein [Verrucomicrobiota bacterium sgz303538]